MSNPSFAIYELLLICCEFSLFVFYNFYLDYDLKPWRTASSSVGFTEVVVFQSATCTQICSAAFSKHLAWVLLPESQVESVLFSSFKAPADDG